MMIFVVVIVSLLALLGFVRRRPASQERTDVDADGVRHTRHDGTVESVAWRDLVRVEVVTTDEGPACEDLFFLLYARDGHGCVVRHDQSQELLPRLQALAGFDNLVFVTACGSTEKARFVCWRSDEDRADG